jgi:RNA polymerase primary sigma factor
VVRSWWADEETVESLYLTRDSDDPGTSFLIVGAHDVASLDQSGSNSDMDDEDGDEDDGTRDIEAMHRRLVEALGRNFWAAMTGGGGRLPLLETSVRTLRNGEVVIEEQKVDPADEQPSRTRALRAFYDGTTVDRLTEAGQVALRTVPLRLPLSGGRRGTLGTHPAVLLVTSAEDRDGVPNQVHSLRGNRMTIKKSGVAGLPLGVNAFQAVLLTGHAAGESVPFADEAEEFLRAAEPPEHDSWGQTEELTLRWSHSAHHRIKRLTTEVNAAVKELVSRPTRTGGEGGTKLRKALTVSRKSGTRRGPGTVLPELDGLDASIGAGGEWQITAEVKLPRGDELPAMTPVVLLDVRSGSRPKLDWAELVAVDGCEVEDGALRFTPGARRAVFKGSTDVSGHPVRTALTRLVVELRAGKGSEA